MILEPQYTLQRLTDRQRVYDGRGKQGKTEMTGFVLLAFLAVCAFIGFAAFMQIIQWVFLAAFKIGPIAVALIVLGLLFGIL